MKVASLIKNYLTYTKLQTRAAVRSLARLVWRPVVVRRCGILLWPPLKSDTDIMKEQQNAIDQFNFYFSGTDVELCYYTCKTGVYERWQIQAGAAPQRVNWGGRPGPLWSQMSRYRAVALQADSTKRGLTAVVPHIVVLSHWGDVVWPSLLREMIPTHIDWPKRTADLFQHARNNWDQAKVAVIGSGPSSEAFLDDRKRITFDHVVVANLVALRPEYITGNGTSSVWICAYDPNFFDAGPLSSDMRLALQSALRFGGNCYFVTSDYLERHLELHYPSSTVERTISVSTRRTNRFLDHWNIDLAASQRVVETGNVGTTLMLPVAATLGQTIVIYGMDGFDRRSDSVHMPHHPALRSDHLDQLSNTPLSQKRAPGSAMLQELEIFESASRGLVQAMLSRGHRVILSRPSLNAGLAGLPILDDKEI